MHPTALLLAASLLGAPITDPNVLLASGPIVSIEQAPSGKFQRCTALARIDAPVEKVWQVVTDYKDYKTFMPKVVDSQVVGQDATYVDVKFEIEVPGVNTKYVMRHYLHPDTHTVEMNWMKGDLKGSRWILHLEPTADGKTLLSYAGASQNFSAILEDLEDSQQTITVGVNVSSALTVVKALKARAEQK
jgi:ribosome-associated toxin RatA of RatAB toxin-antitoxin module